MTAIRRINFYGGPGVGKSTLAALTFGWLRQRGTSAELVQEWIKGWAYAGRQSRSFDDVFTFANQLHAEDELLQAGVELVVSDSPTYLQCAYALNRVWHGETGLQQIGDLRQIADQFEATYPAINFFIVRDDTIYEQRGRYQTLDEAKNVDDHILACLQTWRVPYTLIMPREIEMVREMVRDKVDREMERANG